VIRVAFSEGAFESAAGGDADALWNQRMRQTHQEQRMFRAAPDTSLAGNVVFAGSLGRKEELPAED